ncbi:class II aldolase/adducin family protein [Kitasatospora sp. NBC_01287]|uniref:class II aldolase/adducin family protein n=1 Tax=Kitasatospora sp. NBC_01287 TaxID=2903573 RepID=UPI00225757B4|nr:class II aldolase/adducin family protein [Kitasatospora sp. NBC_01287]MCX4745977.1 class II aldolase/adducin family protein [Kitasatospora sp. NBC_01287]
MMYEPERHQMVSTMRQLKEWGLLNPAGGAISVRASDDRMVISTTGSASRRHWRISNADHIVLDMDGEIVEQTAGLGVSGTPLHLALYRMLPQAGAILHAHAPHSLVFASLGREVPSVTARCDALSDIPCLAADDHRIKREYRDNPRPLVIPAGMIQRPEVAVINLLHYEPLALRHIAPRSGELAYHAIAFTLYRHGVIVVARDIDEAVDALFRVEESAECALRQAALTGGAIHSNRLFRSGA